MRLSYAPQAQPLVRPKPKVLLVDDSGLARNAIRPALLRAGCAVTSLLGPSGVLAVVLRENPDLVLLEVSVPGLRVRHVVEGIQQAHLTKRPTVLLFSAGTEETLRALVQRSGVDGYIPKSEDSELVVSQIMRALPKPGISDGVVASVLRPPPKVLFVAKDPDFLRSLPDVLLDANVASSDFVESGCEALRRVLSPNPPDLVVADTETSDVPGISLYHALVASDGSWRQRFALVVDSQHFDQGLTSFLLQAEVAVLQKPVETDEITRLVGLLNSAPRPRPVPER